MPKKRVLKNDILGRLVFERGCLIGKVSLGDDLPSVEFRIIQFPDVELDEQIRRAVDFFRWACKVEKKMHRRIADEMLDDYNEDWASEESGGQGLLNRTQFLARLKLSAIHFEADDGSAHWYYTDGGLFGGHYVNVRVAPNRTISEVVLEG